MSLSEVERVVITETLRSCAGNKTRTAAVLGISLKTLYNRLNEYGALEVTRLRTDRSGEAAALVTEQLRFDQRRGNGAAVDRDEGLLAPAAQLVNRFGNELFARAAFAGDQDADCSGCDADDALEDVAHRRAGAEELAESEGVRSLL
jgi:hypothetical protein